MRGSRVPMLPVALALALLALAGCGGDDGTTEASDGARGDGGMRAVERPESARPDGRREAGEPRPGGPGPVPEPTGPAPTSRAPLPNEGKKEAAPGVPTARGGDNSIQRFGVEGRRSQRVEASRLLKAYLEARAARRWERACAFLAASLEEELRRFAGRSGGQGSGSCADAMRGLAANVPRSAFRTAADIRVLSMRVERGRSAFLVYRDGEGTPTAIPLSREGGDWRVAALDGSALLLGVGPP